MQSDSRFAVAIHALALAMVARGQTADGAVTSEQMAASANVHPVHVRRVLGSLREAKLVISRPGQGGGWHLARPATEITLGDIYGAVSRGPLLALPPNLANRDCPVGRCLPDALAACFQDAEAALEERLAQTTLAHLMSSTGLDVSPSAHLVFGMEMDRNCHDGGSSVHEHDLVYVK